MRIIVLMVCFALPVSAAKLHGEGELIRRCQNLFDVALPDLTARPAEVAVGTFMSLDPLLKLAGAKPNFISQANWLFAQTFARYTNHPLIAQMFGILHNQSGHPIVIGILNTRLRNEQGSTHVTSQSGPFGIAQVRGIDPAHIQISTQAHSDLFHFVASDPIRHFQGHVEWCDHMLCELSQSSDTELVQLWLNVNLRRLEYGQEPDEWFRKFVIVKDGQAIVDAGFFATVLLSRAAILANWMERDSGVITFAKFKELQADMRDLTIERLKAMGSTTHFVLQELDLKSDNIFEWGIRLGRAMLLTVYP